MAIYIEVLLIVLSCQSNVISSQGGMASYYADSFHNQKTANGEIYDSSLFTAAHRDLPFGQYVRIVSADNGRSVRVRINDRGPFNPGRLIDLSKAAAREIGMLEEGVIKVKLDILKDLETR